MTHICNLCGGSSAQNVFNKEGYSLVRCTDCGLLYVQNPPTDAEREQLYKHEAGYHHALANDPHVIATHRKEARKNLAVLTRYARSGKLLDVGCSTGLFLKLARESGFEGFGLEYSEDSARVAREVHGLPVEQGELEMQRYSSASMDVITLWDVLEHVPDPKRTLEILHDILSPQGWLFLKTPNCDGLYPQISLRVAHLLNYWGHPEPPSHLYQFSAKTLCQMLESTGFEVVRVHQQRIPLSYSFGKNWFRSAKWLGYCLSFAPLALIGPWLKRGDDMVVVARKAIQS